MSFYLSYLGWHRDWSAIVIPTLNLKQMLLRALDRCQVPKLAKPRNQYRRWRRDGRGY
jgi:hypothetical protein